MAHMQHHTCQLPMPALHCIVCSAFVAQTALLAATTHPALAALVYYALG
jgi:hypothetical protein